MDWRTPARSVVGAFFYRRSLYTICDSIVGTMVLSAVCRSIVAGCIGHTALLASIAVGPWLLDFHSRVDWLLLGRMDSSEHHERSTGRVT